MKINILQKNNALVYHMSSKNFNVNHVTTRIVRLEECLRPTSPPEPNLVMIHGAVLQFCATIAIIGASNAEIVV